MFAIRPVLMWAHISYILSTLYFVVDDYREHGRGNLYGLWEVVHLRNYLQLDA
jgi:hypothetical protein